MPFETPIGRWKSISMDFITGLPVSNEGYDMIFVVIDRFTKRARFLPCHTTDDAKAIASAFVY